MLGFVLPEIKIRRDYMPKAKIVIPSEDTSFRPALSPENREDQLIALAIDAAEQQLRNGTASSQVITHYLKLGSTKARLEREILQSQNELIHAKTEALKSAKNMESLYHEAIAAMREYSATFTEEDIEQEEY